MSRLAVGIKPPGGFWKKTQKLNRTVQKMDGKHIISITEA